jgi:hypothetical protein
MRSALALVVALAACTPVIDPGDAEFTDAGPVTLALGTGETAFTPIHDGDTLYLARGCQGLQHVWTSLRATGIAPRGVHVSLAFERVSDGAMVSAPFDLAITFTPDATGAYADLSGLMLVVPVPSDALSMPLVMTGTITDRANRTASASVHVTLAWGTEVCM